MKIDTLEKLEILMFGLGCGRDLNICLERTEPHALYFGDFEGVGFTVDSKGAINDGCITDSMADSYSVMGCSAYAKQEAKNAFNTIRINERKKS